MPGQNSANPRDAATALALAGGFSALYASTLCRTVYWYDSAELTTAAATLGIAHPPGYPVYTWIGHLFTRLPLQPALAVNAMSALFASSAVALTFALARELGIRRAPAVVAAAILGTSGLFWQNAVVAEVYCPAVAAAALVAYLLTRGANERNRALTRWGGFAGGVALGIHMSVATLGLGFAWLAWRNGRDWKLLLESGVAALGGALVFAWVPLRASQAPPLNVCNPSNPEQLAWYLTGGAYRNWFTEDPLAIDRAVRIGGSFADQLTWIGVGLAALGAIGLARRHRDGAIALGLMALGNLAVFVRYGAHDVEVFLLPTTMVLCCLAGFGIQAVSEASSRVTSRDLRVVGIATAAAFALVPISLGLANRAEADLSGFEETEPYLDGVGNTLADRAVILTFATTDEWKGYAVFGMYGQLVLGLRTDVRHWVSPDLRQLARDFDAHPPLYAYAPVAILTHSFEIVPDGPLYRIVAPKPDAAATAARRRRRNRTCGTFTQYEVRNAP